MCGPRRHRNDQDRLQSSIYLEGRIEIAGKRNTPKPIDAGLILFNALNAKEHFEKPSVFKLVESGQEFSPQLSILSSLVMTGALLALSTHEFDGDY